MNKIELDKLLNEKGRRYVLMLYCNYFITLKGKQLDYVLKKVEKWQKEKDK